MFPDDRTRPIQFPYVFFKRDMVRNLRLEKATAETLKSQKQLLIVKLKKALSQIKDFESCEAGVLRNKNLELKKENEQLKNKIELSEQLAISYEAEKNEILSIVKEEMTKEVNKFREGIEDLQKQINEGKTYILETSNRFKHLSEGQKIKLKEGSIRELLEEGVTKESEEGEDIQLGETQKRVFALITESQSTLTEKSICERAKMAQPQVNKILNRLIELNMVEKDEDGVYKSV